MAVVRVVFVAVYALDVDGLAVDGLLCMFDFRFAGSDVSADVTVFFTHLTLPAKREGESSVGTCAIK